MTAKSNKVTAAPAKEVSSKTAPAKTEVIINEDKKTAAPAAKTAEKAVVKAVEKTEEKAVKAEEPAAEAVKKETAKKPAAKKTVKKEEKKEEMKVEEVYVQYGDKEIFTPQVMEKAKQAYVAEGHRESSIKSIRLYIKPEENMAYYVINEKIAGGVQL